MNNLSEEIRRQFGNYYDQFIQISPKLIIGIVLFLVFLFLAGWAKKWTLRLLKNRSDDPILNDFLASMVRMILILIGLLSALQIVGLGGLVTSIMATMGLSAFIIGFAFKDIGENFLAGVIMAFNRPFKLGDIIQVSGFKGRIVELGFRETHVKTDDGVDVYVPNALMLKNPLQNFTIDGFIRYEFSLKLSTQENFEKVSAFINDTLKDTEGVLFDSKMPTVGIKNILGKTYEMSIHYWRDNLDNKIPSHATRTKVIRSVVDRLSAEGIQVL